MYVVGYVLWSISMTKVLRRRMSNATFYVDACKYHANYQTQSSLLCCQGDLQKFLIHSALESSRTKRPIGYKTQHEAVFSMGRNPMASWNETTACNGTIFQCIWRRLACFTILAQVMTVPEVANASIKQGQFVWITQDFDLCRFTIYMMD